MGDNRRYHRMHVEVPITFKVPPHIMKGQSSTLDISGVGMSFLTKEKLSKRQEILIYMDLPAKKSVEIHGQVVRVDQAEGHSKDKPKYKIGVKIHDPMKFNEKDFVKYYANALNDFFKKG